MPGTLGFRGSRSGLGDSVNAGGDVRPVTSGPVEGLSIGEVRLLPNKMAGGPGTRNFGQAHLRSRMHQENCHDLEKLSLIHKAPRHSEEAQGTHSHRQRVRT